MKKLLIAAVFVALMPASAFAWSNNCGGSDCGQAAVDNGQAQAQQQHQTATGGNATGGTAYGGAGGGGGAGGNATGGAGGTGNGYGGNATASGGTSSATGGAASSNSGGNNIAVNTERSAPGFAVASPSAGPCSGFSGGMSVSTVFGGGGLSYGEVEANCRKDQHIIIGLSDAATHAQAAKEWYAMDADLFGHANADPTLPPPAQQSSTSATPAAIQPEQTADAGKPECIGQNTHTNWYANNCPAQ